MARPRNVKRILNVLPSPKQEEDWAFEHATAAGLARAAPSIPAQKDLREANWWKVGDQGSTGSCVGWATADSVLRWHFVKAKRLAENDRLSPRFHWMAAKETDQFDDRPTTFIERDGTSLKASLDVARKFGAVRDKLLPFTSGALYRGDAKTFYATAAQLKISSYFNLGDNLAVWRNWIATKGPILTRLNVDDTWDKAKANKGNLDNVPAEDQARRPRGRTRRLHARAVHRPQQLGYRLGRRRLRVRLARLRAGGLHRGLRRLTLTARLAR